jgi:hypothetical protein
LAVEDDLAVLDLAVLDLAVLDLAVLVLDLAKCEERLPP